MSEMDGSEIQQRGVSLRGFVRNIWGRVSGELKFAQQHNAIWRRIGMTRLPPEVKTAFLIVFRKKSKDMILSEYPYISNIMVSQENYEWLVLE